ncbi:Cro/CI family transcriptional regulator [Serratia fonticola]|uniref:Transcriptional regulator n=1 Tax=Serratia fonticola TaxID=47917 RepID=A0AAW3WV05_SERFO|nr:Cro/CI family transcriptional regulator [Serratia fonticola]MBC3214267.1 transcriptional regulator [Serratia fonticola]NYA13658.1 transcriptional regulator [Serratia fonticola]NYA35118.1 transcriptional regulator [Serratia fonticola]
MFKDDAIHFFDNNQAALARIAGVSPQAVSQWGELVPEGRASRLAAASGGVLVYDSSVYDAYRKAKRSGELNHENQSSD